LLLASYPEGYFLIKENSFAVAVTPYHMDALYSKQVPLLFSKPKSNLTFYNILFVTGIVSSKYKEIKRRGRPSQNLTKEEMSLVIRNKVIKFRTVNRHLIQ
jgi:hypothetical protein